MTTRIDGTAAERRLRPYISVWMNDELQGSHTILNPLAQQSAPAVVSDHARIQPNSVLSRLCATFALHRGRAGDIYLLLSSLSLTRINDHE